MAELQMPDDYDARIDETRARLQRAFDERFTIETDGQRATVRELLDRIGSVDWKGEGYSSPENQRDLSIKFHWGHTHRFADDLRVEGRMQDRHLDLMAQFLDGFALPEDHFQGRRVLDVGCWTGGTTLTLKMLGAAEIVALEEVRKYADTTERLTREVYGFDDVICRAVSLYDFDEGTFDSVYVPGVVYHLSDPVLGLRRLFNRLTDGGDVFVESATYRSDQPVCRFAGNRVYSKDGSADDLNRGGWNWFIPSAPCLQLWMEEAGFDDVRVFHSPHSNRVFGHGIRRQYRPMTLAGLSVREAD